MITLSYSATTINIESPDFPEQIKEDLVQTRARAMGGRVVSVTRTNSTLKNPTLVWNNLNETDFTSLKNFIFNTVDGTTQQFSFTDWNSTTYNARYMGGLEKSQQVAYEQWKVELRLAIV